jgi:3-oxoacyl-[acyl-carrier protein] reductase
VTSRLILVSGASRGLGRTIAEALTADGFQVVGLARHPQGDESWDMRPCDVSDADQVAATFKEFRGNKNLWGFVNAAGIASMNLVLTTPAATFSRIVQTNLIGTMLTNQAAGKLMARSKQGRIINFSTIAVPLGLKGEAAYVASKAGVEGFTRAFAREMADFGVTVNAIAPGPIDTDLIRNVDQDKIAAIVARQIVPRKAVPQDVANIVRMLLDPKADMISGQIINVGGA